MRTLLGSLLLAHLAGCCLGASTPAAPSAAPEPPAADRLVRDGVFTIARPRRVDATPPAHLSAPIPTTLATAAWPAEGPPREQVRARLCAGDAAEIERWLAAAAAATGASSDAIAFAYADLSEFCTGRLCAALRAHPEPSNEAARATQTLALARCGDDEDEERVTAAGVLPRATLAWFSARAYDHPLAAEDVPRVTAAIEGYLGAGLSALDHETCEPVLSVSSHLARAGGASALAALHARLAGAAADCLAWSFSRIPDARLQSAYVAACPRLPHARCDEHVAPTADAAPPPLPELAELEGAARDAELARLRACAEGVEPEARECLLDLAAADRPAAVAVARAWVTTDSEGPENELARALAHFETDAALRSYLAELQLLPADAPVEGPGPTPLEVLLAGGRVSWFDTETGEFPNHHDALLVELALLSPGVLEGVTFEERLAGSPGGVAVGEDLIADSVDGEWGEEPEGSYLLRAYDGSTAYELDAENLGDWYDVDAVVGLLNALAVARGSDVRWLILETGDQTAYVVAGPRAGLERAIDDGWLEPAGTGTSAAARDHEREMIERLIESGALE